MAHETRLVDLLVTISCRLIDLNGKCLSSHRADSRMLRSVINSIEEEMFVHFLVHFFAPRCDHLLSRAFIVEIS